MATPVDSALYLSINKNNPRGPLAIGQLLKIRVSTFDSKNIELMDYLEVGTNYLFVKFKSVDNNTNYIGSRVHKALTRALKVLCFKDEQVHILGQLFSYREGGTSLQSLAEFVITHSDVKSNIVYYSEVSKKAKKTTENSYMLRDENGVRYASTIENLMFGSLMYTPKQRTLESFN